MYNFVLMRILILGFFLLSSVINNTATAQQKHITETRVLKLIATLPEVMKANRHVIENSNGKRHLTIYIDSEPTRQQNYYQLSVAEYNGMNLVPHFRFRVNPRTYSVKFWAVAEDKLMSLKTWRKRHYKDY